MNQAVQPQALPILEIFGKMKAEQEVTIDSIMEKEELWSALGKSEFYHLIKDYVNSLVNSLDDLEGKALENGASLEEIGIRRVVNRLTRTNLLSLVTKIERTAEQFRGPAK
jgi:hypothetical protein